MAETDPRIVDMEREKKDVEMLLQEKQTHQKEMRDFAKDYAKKLIKNYSENKFDLVIQKSNSNVVYNKTGLAIDITDAVMDTINVDELILDEGDAEIDDESAEEENAEV